MKGLYISLLLALLQIGLAIGQECGFEHLEVEIVRSPELTGIKDSVNLDLYNWLENDERSRLRNQRVENPYSYQKDFSSGSRSLCGYNNDYVGWGDAPTVVGNTLTATDLYGGDYFTVYGMQANRSYRISTCGQNDFDTQITVYPQGGGGAVAHNDDACSNNQSEIIFCPTVSGNYDMLIDEWDCDWTILVNTDVTVELIYENRPVYTVPVVFHVVYNTPEENVSNTEIQVQLNILNEHFRRQNIDLHDVPAPFRGQSSDPLIEFCLAQQDPNGNATSGVTRTNTVIDEFQPLPCSPNNCLFDAAQGGANEWDRDRYINIWIANMSGSQCGLGFPKHPFLQPLLSGLGVVIDYQCFGTISGNQLVSRDEGHTLIHEMGHYFGLWHPWGPEETISCATDSVSDTPPQEEPTFGVPSFPYTDNCSTIFPGVMFPNYMDYSNDEVTDMFTYRQTAVFDYALFNWYQPLINSDGCQPGLISSIEEQIGQSNQGALLTSDRIDLSDGVSRTELYDLTGRLIKTSQGEKRVDISMLPKGFYVIRKYRGAKLTGTQRVVNY